ncbi:uncharacterized protein HMPREF1541_10597 [Cyphellophora europaea CBS 101466]|uniref:Uncharacterized protein n=1 Tax=Cyphellophora europaea (strain CBS 101466) TaxID=1220924 RepID=W2S6U2_CYPE1|nr:uncharacterized protein HMPREF1541_10597 [Cyphellophora europaea CBS 101466]ETN44416.1 hypothetical protein HMPREF1541_10597 [Cyphellophora europaea CBS 101466]
MANTSDIPSKPLNSASEITFDAGVIKDEMRTSTESPKLDIMIYHFDAARGGFEAGRCLPFDSHDVVNIYSFQRVLIDMTRTRYSMVKAVIAKEGDKGTEYRVADAARFAVLFRKTEKKAKKSRTSRSLIGVIHKVGEGSKFLDTIKYEGLPLLDRAD